MFHLPPIVRTATLCWLLGATVPVHAQQAEQPFEPDPPTPPPFEPAEPVEPAEPAEPGEPAAPAPVSAEPAVAEAPPEAVEEERGGGRFAFGSFGRIRAASDLDGQSGKKTDIVAHGTRMDLDNYVELELRREDDIAHQHLRIVATIALAGEFFHFDGQFEENIAVRNLFAEVDNALVDKLSLWAGSRMVRGDDVYLLNFWPMDNLNMVGGGARYMGDMAEVWLSAGLTRPNDPFYLQTVQTVPALGFVPQEYALLDRPRFVGALKGTLFPGGKGKSGYKVSLYAEGHRLPEGTRKASETPEEVEQELPEDSGFVVGAQLGGWLGDGGFANLFLRYARGLAVYDPLSTPMQIGTVTSAEGAWEFKAALSANYEHRWASVQLGGYLRAFQDQESDVFSGKRLLEGAIDVRPYVWLGDYAGVALDVSYQAMALDQLDDRTGKQVKGALTKIGIIPFYSPYGRGTYTRPHIRLIYVATLRDEGARALYADADPRSSESVEHFLALGAEWWFDSTSY